MRRPWWLIALFFGGCPWEVKCVTTEPRPEPASLAQVNEELVRGLERCGYVERGRRGAVTLVRVEDASADHDMRCVRSCLHALRDDCESLAQMACQGVIPTELARCSRSCGGMCQHDGAGMGCGGPRLRCGVGVDGMAPLVDGEPTAASFACADGSGSVAAERACDFVEDCPDGSDEGSELGCARLSCAGAEEELREAE